MKLTLGTHRTFLAVAFAALAIMAGAVGAAGAAGNSELNWSSDDAPNGQLYAPEWQVSAYNISEMDGLAYYDDNGDIASPAAHLNNSLNNSYKWAATDIDDDALRQFPRKDVESDNSVTWRNAGTWTSTNVTVTATSTNTGVEALSLATNGSMATGNVATATYDNFSVSSDPEKRVAQVVFDVTTLDSGTHGEVRFVDADGTYKAFKVNASADTSADDVLANATGDGYVSQERLNNVATQSGAGDSSFDGIEKVVVHVEDGDLNMDVTGLDAERKSTIAFGERMEDTDGDGTMETVTVEDITEPGAQTYSSIDAGLDSAFNDATIHDLVFRGVIFDAAHAPGENVKVTIEEQDDYASYPQHAETYQRLKAPAAIDVSYPQGITFRIQQTFVSDRYVTLEFATGTGDADWSDISSWTDRSDRLGSDGDWVVLSSSVNAGETADAHVDLLVTDDEASALMPSTDGGGGGGAQSGGLSALPIVGGLFAVIAGLLRKMGLA